MTGGWTAKVKLTVGIVAALAVVAGVTTLVVQQIVAASHGGVVVVPTQRPEARVVKVYVTGAARHPGVYPLHEGDRVEDALRAAGGPTDAADLTRVNLAALVRDELHVSIPARLPETLPDQPASAPPTGSTSSGGKLDINTAGFADLERLPGIGTVTANKILEHRQRNGPFRRPEELRDLKLVTSATWEKIKDLVGAD